jgi:hypothetical protein
MIYRKAPPQPGRLLLRVVAMAGASAVAGAVACSSSGAVGSVPEPGDGGSEDAVADHHVGIDSGGFMGFADGGGGLMGATDGGVCDEGCGLVGNPDAEADVVTGVVAHPDGGTDE